MYTKVQHLLLTLLISCAIFSSMPVAAQEDVYLVCKSDTGMRLSEAAGLSPEDGPSFEVSIFTGNRIMTVVGGRFDEPMRLIEISPNYVGIGPKFQITINRHEGMFGLFSHDADVIQFGSCSANKGKLF